MSGSPEEASLPEEERTAPEASRSSNASSSSSSGSSSSSSSGDDDKPAKPTAEVAVKIEGGAPPEEPTVDVTSSGVGNTHEQQQLQEKETGRLNLQSSLVYTLTVAGGLALAVAAGFLANKKR